MALSAGPGEHYRGRLMHRITRPDRQAYIARAVLANSTFVEAIFDTPDVLPVAGAPTVDISKNWVTRGRDSYAVTAFTILERGQSTVKAPPGEVLRLAQRRAIAYGLSVDASQDHAGVWWLEVQTPRGRIEVPVIPGDKWEYVLTLAGLGATVSS